MQEPPVKRDAEKSPAPAQDERERTQAADGVPDRGLDPIAEILRLQRTIGNRATAQLIAQGRIGEASISGRRGGTIRGASGFRIADAAAEAEAERIGAEMLRPAKASREGSPSGGRSGSVPPWPTALRPDSHDAALPPDVAAALARPGEPLDPASRAFFEPRLGLSLADVRVHTDEPAHRSAASRGARAYAYGPHLVFGRHQYAPHSGSGRALLSHELVHVAQQAATGQPFLGRQKHEPAATQAQADAVGLDEWLRNPPPARMTAALDGLYFWPIDAQVFVAPDDQLATTAVVFNRLAGPAYDRKLVEKFHAAKPGERFWEGRNRFKGIYLAPRDAFFVIDFLEKELNGSVQISAAQRTLLTAGVALNPVPKQIWLAMPVTIEVTPKPGPLRFAEPNFLAKRQHILNRLAALWWARTEVYTRAYWAWRNKPDESTLDAAGLAFSELIGEFEPYADALSFIHDDPALTKLSGWQLLWPQRRDKKRPLLTDIDDEEAVLFVAYAASQPRDLIRKLRSDPAARRSLLEGYEAYRGRAEKSEGDQELLPQPSQYNAEPLPVRMNSYPPIQAPMFAVATGAKTTFITSVRFSNVLESLSNAFGGWFYFWDAIRVPGDDIANLGHLENAPTWEPSTWDVLKQDLSRDVDYAEEDLEHMEGTAHLISMFGPPGVNPETAVGLNLLLDVTGDLIKSAIRALVTPQEEFDVPFSEPGLYVVRCRVGPRLDDTAKVAQFRRAPAVAWMPVYARSPKSIGEERVQLEVAGRAEAEQRLADIRSLLGGDPAGKDLSAKAREDLRKEADELELGLHGSTLAVLTSQRETLDTQRKRIESGTPAPEDRDVSLSALKDQIEQIDLLIDLRKSRADKLGSAPHRLTCVLALDEGNVISLTIEASQIPPSGTAPRWYVSDLTSPRSEHEDMVGDGTLAPGHPTEDSILAALRKLLQGEGGYGRGWLTVSFPADLTLPGEGPRLGTIRIAASDVKIALHAIESLSTLLSIAAVVAAPFTAGGSLVLLMPAGLIGAIPSAYRLAHRAEMGTLRFDLETATQVLDIATAALQLGEIGAGARAVAGAGTRAGLRWAVVEGSLWIVGLGANGFGMLLMGAGLIQQLQALNDLPPGLRAARITEIIGNAMLQAGIQIGAHLASGKYLRGIEGGVRGVAGGEAPGAVRTGFLPGVAEHGRPAGRSEPAARLESGLPADVRRTTPLDIDSKLRGGTVHVEYAIGANGRVDPGSIRMVAGPKATPADIALHAETARTLHAYAGLLGAAHEGIQSLRGVLQGHRAPEQGSAVWEAQMELAKLEGILRDRMHTVSGQVLDDARAVEVASDIANLRAQLEQAQGILAGIDPADPRGFIAAESAEQRGVRIAAENRKFVADNNVGVLTLGSGGAVAQAPAAGMHNPAPGYAVRQSASGPVLSRLPTAGDAPLLILVRHGDRLYIAPGVPADSKVGAVTHENNIKAQLDKYPPPRPGHHWTPDEGGGWQLQRDPGYGGPARRIKKENGRPVQAADGSFSYTELPAAPRFVDRQVSAKQTQPGPETRSTALEAELDRLGVSVSDDHRAILRRWSATLAELGNIGSEALGLDLPSEGEVARRAVEALARQLGPDGTYQEARYDDFRYALRDAAIAAIFGFDVDPIAAFVNNNKPLPHAPRTPAEQRAIYDRLYASMPDSASRGELWTRYREMRGRLAPEQGGFGAFERIPIPTYVLQKTPETRIDGGIRIPKPLGPGTPPVGKYAVESKGGESFSKEQSLRYSNNLAAHNGELVGDGGERYNGVVYLFDDIATAEGASRSLDANRRDGNIFVAYVDKDGAVQWVPRTIKGRVGMALK